MRCLANTGAILAAIFFLAVGIRLTSAGMASTLEDAYIATRDAAIAKIKADEAAENRGPTGSSSDKIIDEDNRALASLERQMRAIVGAVAIKGMTGEAKINLDTLIEGDEGFGLLDGMIFGAVDAKTRVIVTTDSMFRRWLRQHKNWWGKNSGNIPQEPSVAVKENDFYTQAVLTDAAILRFADLPIRKPAGAPFAYAMLASRTQSEVPPKADEIFVAVAQGGRVFIAYTSDLNPVGPIATCDAIRSDLVKYSIAVVEEQGSDKEARREKSDGLSGKSESEFLRCFAERAPQQSAFTAAIQAAQELLDRLPER